MDDRVTLDRVTCLIARVAYLDELNERHGVDRHRMREIDALSWVLDFFRDAPEYADVVARAEQRAAELAARRRERADAS